MQFLSVGNSVEGSRPRATRNARLWADTLRSKDTTNESDAPNCGSFALLVVQVAPSQTCRRRDPSGRGSLEAAACGHDRINSRRPSLTEKHLERVEQRLRIVVGLINGRRLGAALEQGVNGIPGGAGGVFDGERDLLRNLDVLADEAEIGRPLGDHARPVALPAWQ